MSPSSAAALLIPAAYLAGSVPFGLFVGWSKGIDVRKAGSGNIGATNVGRLLGGKFFAIVFILDLLKGLIPMLIAGPLLESAGGSIGYLLWLAVGLAAIAGHMGSLFLKFKGGKGVATSAGVVLGLFPYFTYPAILTVAIWAVIFGKTKIVSLASIVAAAVFPLAYLGIALAMQWQPFQDRWPLLAFSLLITVMIVGRHRANIGRLKAGTEHRFGRQNAQRNGNLAGPSNGDGTNGHSAGPGRP